MEEEEVYVIIEFSDVLELADRIFEKKRLKKGPSLLPGVLEG